jgi:hypothetical protein
VIGVFSLTARLPCDLSLSWEKEPNIKKSGKSPDNFSYALVVYSRKVVSVKRYPLEK